ncbi:hypothetical protein [Crocosphaera sp.]|uniref:hypothetical protein n=1 Tax=Crocosphaera sp. TaxID=2729996 RepID=UPI00261DC937|nr:hypothetical protein [Crocosphaera sp.]MDJ0582596.1 hypothetical protein [Crocosphaera sp.]
MDSSNKKRRRSLARKVDNEVEKIIYKVMTNEGLEQTIARAVVKGLIALIRRYFLLGLVGIFLLLILQSVLISLCLKFMLGLD